MALVIQGRLVLLALEKQVLQAQQAKVQILAQQVHKASKALLDLAVLERLDLRVNQEKHRIPEPQGLLELRENRELVKLGQPGLRASTGLLDPAALVPLGLRVHQEMPRTQELLDLKVFQELEKRVQPGLKV
jgi:hypothetical protein